MIGLDGVPVEAWTILEDISIGWLKNLFNKVYKIVIKMNVEG